MTLRVAVDFGTSSTCIAVSRDGREPRVVAIDGRPVLSSAVYAAADGTLFVGLEAERQAAVDPSRFEPNPKRRIDEPELLLGSSVVPVHEVIRAVLTRAAEEARRFAGGVRIDQLVLTHPADWGGIRTRVLRQAATGLAERIALVPEPVAAAVFHADTYSANGPEALAVLDLGGGTVDVSVVRRSTGQGPRPPGQGFQVLATKGDPSFGGADVDQALLQHVGRLVSNTDPDAWRALIEGRELTDRRRRRVVSQDVQGAKETLSRHTYTDVPLPDPFADAHVTRADLEQLIAPQMGRTVELAAAAIRESGLAPGRLTAIFLVGGSSRIPMVARLVHERLGVMPTTLDQPETVVARGALSAVPPPDLPSDQEQTIRTPRTPAGQIPAGQIPVGQIPVGRTPSPQVPAGQIPAGQISALPRQLPSSPPPPIRYPPQPGHQPPPQARQRKKGPWLITVGVLMVVAAAVLTFVLTGTDEPPPPSGRTIAQFDYQFTMPLDWKQVSADTQNREVRVKPENAEQGIETVIVQELALNFDGSAERDRAVRTLRGKYQQSTLRLEGLDEKATYAGRQVVSYRQLLDKATVEWFVLFEGRAQVSIGCQYADAARDRVMSACDQVVRTMKVTK
ncbi:MAG: type VII secretion-associated protein [Kibdelosporangium sp.]